MKKVLFITRESLANPKRGTPIRICGFVTELQKEHEVILSAPDSCRGFTGLFFKYPEIGLLQKIKFFTRLVKTEKIELVVVATDIEIDLPVWIKFFTGVKIAIDLHGLYASEMHYQGLMSRPKSELLQRKINLLIRFYDLVFAVSQKLVDFYGPKLKKAVVVYGGVAENQVNMETPVEDNDTFVVGYTGNAKAYQGLDQLLNVLSRIKEKNLFPFRLNMIMSSGQGEIEETLKKLNLLEISDLSFKIPHDEVQPLVVRSSVLVLVRPSIPMTEYAFPSKLPEYLVTGLPVITTRVGPVWELFDGEDCPIIISPDRIEKELEEALVKLFEMSVSQRRDLGRKGAKYVRENLTWTKLGKIINKAVHQV